MEASVVASISRYYEL